VDRLSVALLASLGTLGAVAVWQRIDHRLSYLERRPAPPVPPSAELEAHMREMRRQAAHEFIEELRAEGLVIKEAA
jgi:hypothetical protein